MMNDIFELVLQSSIKSSILILGVLLLKKFLNNRMNVKWHKIIWFVVIIRLLIPWAPQSQMSMYNAVNILVQKTQKVWNENILDSLNKDNKPDIITNNIELQNNENTQSDIPEIYEDINLGIDNNIESVAISSRLNKPVDSTNTFLESLLLYLSYIWLTGAILFIGFISLVTFKFKKLTKQKVSISNERLVKIFTDCKKELGLTKEIQICETSAVDVPLLAGVFKPTIFLPTGVVKALTHNEFAHIIMHEMIHCAKKDNWLNIILLIIRAIHWFNPLVHYAVKKIRIDTERYCDAVVLEKMEENEHMNYGKTLLKLAVRKKRVISSLFPALAESNRDLKGRIKGIAGFTKGTSKFTVVAILILTLVACTSLSNEVENVGSKGTEKISELEPVELHFYLNGYRESEPYNINEINKILEKLGDKLEKTIKVTPKIHWVKSDGDKDFESQIETLINSGVQVDGISMRKNRGLYEKGLLLDLNEVFVQNAPEYYKELNSTELGKEKIQNSMIDGKLYKIPNNAVRSPRHAIVARKDLMEKYNFDGFETLEEYGEFLEHVKQNEKDIVGGYVNSQNFFDAYLKGNGYYKNEPFNVYGSLNETTYKVYSMEQTEGFVDAYNLIRDWKNNDYIMKDNNGSERSDYSLMNGKLASELIDMEFFHNRLVQVSEDYEYSTYPLYMDSPHLLKAESSGISLPIGGKHPERVMMFIELLYSSQELYDLFIYGIVGEHYELKDEKVYFPRDMDLKKNAVYGRRNLFFNDYRHERPYIYEPDKDLYPKSSLENVVTVGQLSKKFENDPEKLDDAELKERSKDFVKVVPILEANRNNTDELCQAIDNNDFSISIEAFKQKQLDIKIDEYINYIKSMRFGGF